MLYLNSKRNLRVAIIAMSNYKRVVSKLIYTKHFFFIVALGSMSLASFSKELRIMEGFMPAEFNHSTIEIENPPLSCKLNIIAEQNVIDGVFVDFVLLNQSDSDLSVLTWYTPLEGFLSNLFIVTDKYGEKVAYQGPMVKRAKPTSIDYQLIRAKGNVATMLDLSSVYSLIPGDYNLQLNKKTLQVVENGMPASVYQCQTDTLTFSVQ